MAPVINLAKLLSGESTLAVKAAIPVNGEVENLTVYVVAGAGVSAGVITIEESHDPDYTGTWSSIGTVTTAAASICQAVHLQGTYKALRVRISTGITGGTVDVYVSGR